MNFNLKKKTLICNSQAVFVNRKSLQNDFMGSYDECESFI